jgi:hypothetical protein
MNKETKKYRLLKTAVDEEMEPAILSLQDYNYEKSI